MEKGKHHSKKTREKISEALKGRTFSEEHKRNIGEARKGKTSPMKGKHHTAETKKRIGEANKGKSVSLKTRRKMSEAKRGNRHPQYGKKGVEAPNFGRNFSEETRRKMSERQKGKKAYWYGKHLSEKTKRKISDSLTDWSFVKKYGTTRHRYPYSINFSKKNKKAIRNIYSNKCVVTGITQEEHIKKYGKGLVIHHWNHDKETKDPFYMVPVAEKINNICKDTGKNKDEWMSLFNGIVENKWCEMLKNKTLEPFYKEFGCCLPTNI